MRNAACQQAQALELLVLEDTALELDALLGRAAIGLEVPDATGRHRQLAAHADQVIELLLSRRSTTFHVTERAEAERAEWLVQEAQRYVDDGAVAERGDELLVRSGIR